MVSSRRSPSLSLRIPSTSSPLRNTTREHVESVSENQEQKRPRHRERHAITWASPSPAESSTSTSTSSRPSTPEPHRPSSTYLPSTLSKNDANEQAIVFQNLSHDQTDSPVDSTKAACRGYSQRRRQSVSPALSRSLKALEIAPGVFISASCKQHEAMRPPPCEENQQPQLKPTEISAHEDTSHLNNSHVMLLSKSSSTVTECLPENWDRALDDDVLRHHYARRDIVLDSVAPHIVPHIVVTPPQESSEDYYIPWRNRVDPQWPGFLMVPPYDVSITRLPLVVGVPLVHSPIHYGLPRSSVIDSKAFLDKTALTKRPFSPSQLNRYVDATSNERLFMYYVVTAVRRHHFKAAAIAASILAPSFRERYDEPEYISSIEKPFRWVDAAELILSVSRRIPGSTIIDSPNPCTVPHIIISAPPPEDPWTAWRNATNDPQDAGHGRFLTVPCRPVHYVNLPSPPLALEWHEDETETFSSNEDLSDDLSDSDSLSPPGSPGPETPVCIHGAEHGDFFFIQHTKDGDEDLDDVFVTPESLDHLVKGLCRSSFSQTRSIFNEDDDDDDDDDDDLPEFDSWYQNIASRSLSMTAG